MPYAGWKPTGTSSHTGRAGRPSHARRHPSCRSPLDPADSGANARGVATTAGRSRRAPTPALACVSGISGQGHTALAAPGLWPRWRLDKAIQPSAPCLKPSHGTDSSPVNSCQAPASPAFPILAQAYRPAWFNSSCSARKRWWRSRNSAMKSVHAGSRDICRYRSRIVVR